MVLWSGKDSPFVTSFDRRATSCKTQYFIFCSGYKPPGLIPLFRNVVNHIFNYNVSSLALLIQNIQSGTNGKRFLCLSDIKGCQDHLYSASLCKWFYNPSFFQYYACNKSKNAGGSCNYGIALLIFSVWITLQDDRLSQTLSIDTVIPIDSNGDITPEVQNSDDTSGKNKLHKPALRQSSSKTHLEAEPSPQSKTRSLSWRSDVINRDSSQTRVTAESISSHVSSIDSAIDTKSISPIDTGMNGSRTMASLADRNAMSLPRVRKTNSSVKRGKRFSSLQSPSHKQHPPKVCSNKFCVSEFGVGCVSNLNYSDK